MSNVLVIRFNDFKNIIGNKRLYYYVGKDFFDFHCFCEGIILKTSLLKAEIPNMKSFFSNSIFYNSIQIKFRISDPDNSIFDIEGIRQVVEPQIEVEEETQKTDIQREGVE